jgi:hypothetical protein
MNLVKNYDSKEYRQVIFIKIVKFNIEKLHLIIFQLV